MTATFALPPALAPGDLVVVVAPSSPFLRDDLWPGLAWLRTRYRIRLAASALARDGYLAGDDERRRTELARAFVDPEAKAIVATRGGYGAMRVALDLPWSELARRPKWLVGFSDITTLHALASREGIASIHGPNVTGLGPQASPWIRAAWLSAVEGPTAPRVWGGLRVVHPGRARGTMLGGNLAILHAMAASGCLFVPEGAVLALEDVTEAPYRVDRMLTSLQLGGHLARASAIVFGGFERCSPGLDGRTIDEVLEERTRSLGIPVLAGAPFGHGTDNEAFVIGQPATVEGDEVRLAT
ncbi:MAG TPA: LD-carboxypeptidase [Polyangiaceae bacterium]|jgi:muramoyltetrapeptide carboxypeptidase|nr:LD-carboxypeptidase [Polyangiaceae bacterium]